MKKEPLISVIMPTYNGSKSIKRAIHSFLNQTYKNTELIVIDDCSTDNTVDVVNSIKDSRIKLIRHSKNKNCAAARNSGIKVAKGEYIAFLDDDDEWLEEKLSKQIDYFLAKKSKEWGGVLVSHKILYGGKYRDVVLKKEGDISKEIYLMELSLAAGSSLMVRRDVFEKIGNFNEKYVRQQDLDFVLRLLREYKMGVMRDVLSVIHGHSGKVSGERLVEIKERLLSDFKEDIESFDKRTVKRIYARQYLQISKHFAMDGNIKMTMEYLFKSLSYALLFSNRVKFLILENYLVLPFYLLRGLIVKEKDGGR